MNDPAADLPSLSTPLIRNRDIFASEIDDEMVMMDGEKGLYFGLNSVARRIWELLEKPLAYGDLLRELAAEYSIEDAQCRADVEPFLRKMLENRLIRVHVE
jgi:hypothetical protein